MSHHHRHPFVPLHPRNLRAFVLDAIALIACAATAPAVLVILVGL